MFFAEPLQRLRNQLRTVVHPQHLRRPAGRGEHLLELGDEPLGGDRSLHQMQQRFTGVFVDHRRDLDGLAVGGGIELEVDRPHHLRGVGDHLRRRGRPGPFTRAMDPALQPLLAPQPVHLLHVDHPGPRRGVAPPRRAGTHGTGVWWRRNATRPAHPCRGRSGVWACGSRRWVERESPTALHANRSDMLNVSLSMSTARRLAAGLRIFPSLPPAARP